MEVKSSNIKSIEYNSGCKTLTVEFLSGSVYAYGKVEKEVFDELVEAESKGRFMNQRIYGKYDFVRLK